MTADCVFCGIVAGRVPAKVLYSDAHVVAFASIDPKAPLHALVVPRRHIADVAALDDLELGGRLLAAAAAVAREAGYAERGFRLVTNTGPDAGQSVFHLHVHVLAGRHLDWPPG